MCPKMYYILAVLCDYLWTHPPFVFWWSKQIQDSWQTKILEWEIAPVGGSSWAGRLHGACWEGSLRLEGFAGPLGKSIEAPIVLAVTLVVDVRRAKEAKGTGRKQSMKIHLNQEETWKSVFSMSEHEASFFFASANRCRGGWLTFQPVHTFWMAPFGQLEQQLWPMRKWMLPSTGFPTPTGRTLLIACRTSGNFK